MLTSRNILGQISIDAGAENWVENVQKSLNLIKKTDSLVYKKVILYCDRISFWGGNFSTTEDGNIILISRTDANSNNINNIACVIVHESKHLELLKTKSLTQKEEECICYQYELDFLNRLENPESFLKENCYKYLRENCI